MTFRHQDETDFVDLTESLGLTEQHHDSRFVVICDEDGEEVIRASVSDLIRE